MTELTERLAAAAATIAAIDVREFHDATAAVEARVQEIDAALQRGNARLVELASEEGTRVRDDRPDPRAAADRLLGKPDAAPARTLADILRERAETSAGLAQLNRDKGNMGGSRHDRARLIEAPMVAAVEPCVEAYVAQLQRDAQALVDTYAAGVAIAAATSSNAIKLAALRIEQAVAALAVTSLAPHRSIEVPADVADVLAPVEPVARLVRRGVPTMIASPEIEGDVLAVGARERARESRVAR